jgi:probable phosphoglycerate mutase
MKKIIMIQHTQAEHHNTKMVGGNTDWPLTEIGKEHAHKIGGKLKILLEGKNEYTIYSSDLVRTKQTAEIINEYLNYKIIFGHELREINVGIAKGKTNEWYQQNCSPKGDTPFIYYRPFSDAETCEDVYNRLAPFVNEIVENDKENIIIVGHGISFRLLILHWLKIPLKMGVEMSIEGSAGGVSFLSENKDKIRILNVWNDKTFIV